METSVERNSRLLAVIVVGCCVAFLWGCHDNTPTESRVPIRPAEPPQGIFVAPGGVGDGSAVSPLGTIQAAVDLAGQSDSRDTIYLAIGTYHESITIDNPVVIYGGRDADFAWQPAEYGVSTILGALISNQAVAIYLSDIVDTVELSSLHVTAADAVDSGGSSIGVVCSNITLLKLSHCYIQARNGMRGMNGSDGDPGIDGVMLDSPVFMGGRGGSGAGACASCIGGPGYQGFCADGLATGGAGGSAVWAVGIGYDGYPGPEGSAGGDGVVASAMPSLVILESDISLSTSVGGTGAAGSPGCGGGGGGGSPTWEIFTHTYGLEYTGGLPGGDGGNGGGGGFGGIGGVGGGCSIAILVHLSSVEMDSTTCFTMSGGAGGTGGTGGSGGTGAPGKPPRETENIGIGSQAGDGGPGGDGGRGGHGGGGAGGSSIAVLATESTVSGIDSSLVHLGTAGLGGASAGLSGEHGLRLTYLDISE